MAWCSNLLKLKVFIETGGFYKACGYKIEPLQQVKKKMLGCFAPINHSYYIDRTNRAITNMVYLVNG